MPELIKGELHYSYDEIHGLVKNIAEQITDQKITIDIIVAIATGGWFPARVIRTLLPESDSKFEKPVYSVGFVNYDKDHNRLPSPILTQELPSDLSIEGKTVLLVDEVSDSGATVKKAIEYIGSRGASKIYTAVLHLKQKSEYRPDFIGEYANNKWINYPWDKK